MLFLTNNLEATNVCYLLALLQHPQILRQLALTATPTEEPTSTPTATPTDSPGSDSGTGGDSTSSSEPAGQVLGTETMASTGTAEEALFNFIFIVGSFLSAFGIRKFSSSRVK